KILRKFCAAITVEVREARAHRRHRHSNPNRGLNCKPPVRLGVADPSIEVIIQQQVRQIRTAIICVHNRVQEARANYTTALPNPRHLAEIDVPVILVRTLSNEIQALRIRTNLRGVQRVVDRSNKLVLIYAGTLCSGTFYSLARDCAFLFHAREHSRIDGGGDSWNRNALVKRLLGSPLARAFLFRRVEDEIDERLACFRIAISKYVRGDLDQKRFERSPVPFIENVRKLRSVEPQC